MSSVLEDADDDLLSALESSLEAELDGALLVDAPGQAENRITPVLVSLCDLHACMIAGKGSSCSSSATLIGRPASAKASALAVPVSPGLPEHFCENLIKRRRYSEPQGGDLPHDLVNWSVEIQLRVAAFLPWFELARGAQLCLPWLRLERKDILWQAHFSREWPRLARRKDNKAGQMSPWRALFRARWSEPGMSEDALAEDWLDFDAAQDLGERPPPPPLAEAVLQRAVERCKGDILRVHGVRIPVFPDLQHLCMAACRFHRVPSEEEAFVCEKSGAVHICHPSTPCHFSVKSDNDCFMVCPVSGRCVPEVNLLNPASEEISAWRQICSGAAQECPEDLWDTEVSGNALLASCFEHGYGMSEKEARQAGFFRNERPTPCSVRGRF